MQRFRWKSRRLLRRNHRQLWFCQRVRLSLFRRPMAQLWSSRLLLLRRCPKNSRGLLNPQPPSPPQLPQSLRRSLPLRLRLSQNQKSQLHRSQWLKFPL